VAESHSFVAGGEPSGESAPADLVVLIALGEELETFRAVLARTLDPDPDKVHGGYAYRFEAGSPTPYQCVVSLLGAMGPDAAGIATDRLISRYAPEVVATVGLAAGIHGDARLGTVVVAEQVDAYLAEAKAVPDQEGWTFQHRGRVFRSDHALVKEVGDFPVAHRAAFDAWLAGCEEDQRRHVQPASFERLVSEGLMDARPQLLTAHLASGPVVGAAKAFSAWLHQRDAILKALDMETAGLAEAAHSRVDPVRTLAIRGVSDLGDERKKALDEVNRGGLRRVAMGNATRFLLALLDRGLLPRRSNQAVTPAPAKASVESAHNRIESTVSGGTVQVANFAETTVNGDFILFGRKG
jgi:nucleoside phosphorylase